jgi:hypothetical protein
MTPDPRFHQRLRAIDLSRVAVSAATTDKGEWGRVAGMGLKLKAAWDEAARRPDGIRYVVVAHDQDDVVADPPGPVADRQRPYRILKARSLADAVDQLYQHLGPRRAVRIFEQARTQGFEILGRPAAWAQHFCPLPLFVRLQPKELPRGAGSRSTGEEASGDRRQLEQALHRWEEEILRQERKRYEQYRLEEVFSQRYAQIVERPGRSTPRLVVIGPPGSGKTTLWQHLGQRVAYDERLLPGHLLIPVSLRLPEWARAGCPADLPAYLHVRHASRPEFPSREQWHEYLERGDACLLLDGLDELELAEDEKNQFREAFTLWPHCPVVITCRTVSFEQFQGLCPAFDVFILGGLDSDNRNRFIRAFPAAHPGNYDPEQLIAELDRLSGLQALASNPQLLAVLCYVVDDPVQQVQLPATRAELYDRAVDKLLAERRHPVSSGLEAGDLRDMLERLSLRMFAEYGRKVLLGREDLNRVLREALRLGDSHKDRKRLKAVKKELTRNSGILRGEETRGYFFLHLTFMEFLTASRLGKLINDPRHGWDKPLRLGGRSWLSLRQFVDRKAWDSAWQEVLCLLAGRLHQPIELLQMVSEVAPTPTNPYGDDLLRHRLALAGRCCLEVRQSYWTPAIKERTTSITDALIANWWYEWEAATEELVNHVWETLMQLASGLPHCRKRILLALASLDWPRDGFAGYKAVRLLEKAVQSGLPGEANDALHTLRSLLNDKDGAVTGRAVCGLLSALGDPFDRPELFAKVIAVLRRSLHHEDANVVLGAAQALAGLGERAGRHEFVTEAAAALRSLFDKQDGHVVLGAAQALAGLGERAGRHEFVTEAAAILRGLFGYETGAVAFEAACGLADLGERVGRSEFVAEAFTTLRGLLNHEIDYLYVAEILPDFAERVDRPELVTEVIVTLCVMLRHEDASVVPKAAEALARLAERVGRPELVDEAIAALRELLDKQVGRVFWDAANALVEIGDHIGRPDLEPVTVSAVRALLHHAHADVVLSGAKALADRGERSGRPELVAEAVATLRGLLRHEDARIILAGAQVLVGLEESIRRPELAAEAIAALRESLHHEEARIILAGAQVLVGLEESIRRPDLAAEVIAALSGMLDKYTIELHLFGAKALKALDGQGERTYLPGQVAEAAAALRGLPHHGDAVVIQNVANVLARLEEGICRPELVAEATEALRDILNRKCGFDFDSAAEALARLGERAGRTEIVADAVTALHRLLDDESLYGVIRAANALAGLGEHADIPVALQKISSLLPEKDVSLSGEIAKSLAKLSTGYRFLPRTSPDAPTFRGKPYRLLTIQALAD